ncbi:MAG: hypothetical protein ABEI06_05240, partial [Halobacteriaceae archaeon]
LAELTAFTLGVKPRGTRPALPVDMTLTGQEGLFLGCFFIQRGDGDRIHRTTCITFNALGNFGFTPPSEI